MATVDDAELIAEQRLRMFVDAGQGDAAAMQAMRRNFVAWVTPRLVNNSYSGWIVEQDGVPVGGAGVWWMDFPPHWMDAAPARAYLLNFYVVPECRGQGLAVQLLRLTIAETRRRGVKVATLHASKFGRPIYEREGFLDTNEMMLRLE